MAGRINPAQRLNFFEVLVIRNSVRRGAPYTLPAPWRVLAILAFAGFTAAAVQPRQATADENAYQWKPVAIGAGGFITGIDADPTGETRVIRTDVYGAYIWLAEERRWSQLVTVDSMPPDDRHPETVDDGVYEIVVAPSKPDRIYMALNRAPNIGQANGFIYRSDDRGRHFTRVSRPGAPIPVPFNPNSRFRFTGQVMAVSPTNPDLVFLGTPRSGLLRSEDGGVSWRRVESIPLNATLSPSDGVQAAGDIVWFEPAAAGKATRVWSMSQGNGLFVSNDNGLTFESASRQPGEGPKYLRSGAFLADGTFFGADYQQRSVWSLRDGVWTNLTTHPGLSVRPFEAVAINPHSGEIYVFDEGGKVFRSSDGGETWGSVDRTVTVGPGDPPWLRVNNLGYFSTAAVRFDPVVANRMWIGAGVGVFYADVPPGSSRITWISQSRGIEELVANDVVSPPGGSPLFAAWDFGIHLKPDLDAYSTTYGPKERVLIAAQQLDWSASDPKFIVTNASDTRTCCAEDGNAVMAGYSLDGGRTWAKFATLPTPPGTQPNDPWRMSFGTIAVAANDPNNIVWEPTKNRSPFYTKDRGATWNRVVLPGEKGPFTGSHEIYYLARKTLAADRVQPNVFYLYHTGENGNGLLTGLWKTTDGGAQWQKVFTGEISPQSRFSAKLRAVPGKAGNLFFTSGNSRASDSRLRRSTDGGTTWTPLPTVDRVDDVAFGKAANGADYPAIYISGFVSHEYGIWRSTDNAATWQRVGGYPLGSLDQVSVIEGDKQHFGQVYVGFKGSGWMYGTLSNCSPSEYRRGEDAECVKIH